MNDLNKDELKALNLLARGGARYGTRITEMQSLKAKGLCYAHDNGEHRKKGRWTWRPTEKGWTLIKLRQAAAGGVA